MSSNRIEDIRPKQFRRGPDLNRYRRGELCGLVSVTFIAEMLEVHPSFVFYHLKKWTERTGIKPRSMSARHLFELLTELSSKLHTGSVEKYIYDRS